MGGDIFPRSETAAGVSSRARASRRSRSGVFKSDSPFFQSKSNATKDDRHVRGRGRKQIRSFALSAQPFLQIEEGQLPAVLEGHDLAIEDQFVLELARAARPARELLRHAAQIAREDFHAFRAAMKLRANAVEFVFDVNRSRRRDCRPRSVTAATANRAQIASAVGSGLASMHLIGRNSDSSARCNSPLEASSAVCSDVAEKHVRFLHVIERSVERGRDRFFHETFAQTDPQIAGQNLDHILTFARREFGEARLQKLRLGQRTARFVERFEKLASIRSSANGSGAVRPSSASSAVLPASPCELAMRRNSGSLESGRGHQGADESRPSPTWIVRRSLCGKALPVK